MTKEFTIISDPTPKCQLCFTHTIKSIGYSGDYYYVCPNCQARFKFIDSEEEVEEPKVEENKENKKKK